MREGWVSARTTATPRRLGIAFALGLISWGGQLLSYHFCARAVGLQIPIGDSVLVLAATNLSFVVRVTPGNVGVFQIVFVATAAMLGMPRETAAAAAVVLQALEMVPVLLVAGLIVAPGVWRARRPRLA